MTRFNELVRAGEGGVALDETRWSSPREVVRGGTWKEGGREEGGWMRRRLEGPGERRVRESLLPRPAMRARRLK